MRSFIASVMIIALMLIGQQWVAKSSEAQSAFRQAATGHMLATNSGYADWMAGR